MPTRIHLARLETDRRDHKHRRDYMGALRFSPEFTAYLENGLDAALVEVRLPATRWHESPYLVRRLAAHFDPALVRACVQLRQLRAEVHEWEASGEADRLEPADFNAQHAMIAKAERQLAASLRRPDGRPSSRDWLDTQDRKLLRYVRGTFYEGGRRARRYRHTDRPQRAAGHATPRQSAAQRGCRTGDGRYVPDATASGTPPRSTTRWRLVPGSPRSVGLGADVSLSLVFRCP
jgi:hypothetical protein